MNPRKGKQVTKGVAKPAAEAALVGDDISFSTSALGVVNKWIAPVDDTEESKSEGLRVHTGRAGIGASTAEENLRKPVSQVEKQLERKLQNSRRHDDSEDEASRERSESDDSDEEESRATALSKHKKQPLPVKDSGAARVNTTTRENVQTKKKKANKKKKSQQTLSEPKHHSEEEPKTEPISSSTQLVTTTTPESTTADEEDSRAAAVTAPRRDRKSGQSAIDGQDSPQEPFIRKRKKTRSKQKNIRKDHRPMELRPSYLRPGSQDYMGRDLTVETQQRLGFDLEPTQPPPSIIEHVARPSPEHTTTQTQKPTKPEKKRKKKAEKEALAKLDNKIQAVHESVSANENDQRKKIKLSRGMYAIDDRKSVQ